MAAGSSFRLMVTISLLFFWTPLVGSFAAGCIGAKHSPRLSVAIFSAVTAALPLSLVLFILRSHLEAIPVQGALVRAGGMVLIGSHLIALITGAVAGYSHG